MKVEKRLVLLLVVAWIVVASIAYSEPARFVSSNATSPLVENFINYSSSNYTLSNQTNSTAEIAPPVIESSYFLGENVEIYLGNFSNISLVEINSETANYKFAGIVQDKLQFKSSTIGVHELRIQYGSRLFKQNFTVKKDIKTDVYLQKKVYDIEEIVLIYFNISNKEGLSLLIKAGNDVFRSLGQIESPFNFIPKGKGNYSVELYRGDDLLSKASFEVIEEKVEEEQIIEKEVEITFTADFSELVEKKKTIIDRIFGINPVTSVSFYVENHTFDDIFNLSLEQIGEYEYRGEVYPNHNASTGLYNSVIEIIVHGESIMQTKQFYWENIIEEEIKPEIIDKPKLLQYSFSIDEVPSIEIDFTNLQIERDILEQVLKKPKIEKISAYLEGYAYDDSFVVDFEHIEYDKFNVKIKKEQIIPDIYKLVVVAKTGEVYQVRDKLFNWGLEDGENIRKKIDILNKTTILNEVIGITKINATVRTEDKIYTEKLKYEVNDSVKLYSNSLLEKVQIFSNNVSFFYTETFANGMSFAPPKPGDYTIQALVKNKTGILSATFRVVDNFPVVLGKLNFSVKNNRNQKINSIIRIYGENKELLREENSIITEGRNTAQKIGRDLVEGRYEVEIIPSNLPIKRLIVDDLLLKNASLDLGMESVPNDKVNIENQDILQAYAINPEKLDFSEGRVTVTASGRELYKCKEWNFTEQVCYGNWVKVMDLVPGQDYSIPITMDDPGFAETNISVLNVQSYPTVGGKWKVEFNTVGVGNLTIRAINGTTWSTQQGQYDLRFLSVGCGGNNLGYTWSNNEVIVENYECNQTGYEESLVITTGSHYLEFEFNGQKAYAQNYAYADFHIQRMTVTNFGAGEDTMDIAFNEAINDTSKAFIRITNAGKYSGGPPSSAANMDVEDMGVIVELLNTTHYRLTRSSSGTNNDQRVELELIEYTGLAGGPNEFVVRSNGTIGETGGGTNTASVSGVSDVDKVVPYLTGIVASTTGNAADDLTATLYMSDSSTLTMERSSAGGTTTASYAIVEYVGSNWVIGHSRHDFTADSTATIDIYEEYDAEGSGTVLDINNWSQAIIEFSYQATNGQVGIEEATARAWNASSTSQLLVDLEAGADGLPGSYSIQTHIISNPNFIVQWLAPSDPGGADSSFTTSVNSVSAMNQTSVHASLTSSGTGTAYNRQTRNYQLTDASTVSWWGHRTGNTLILTLAVAQWPTEARVSPNVTLNYPPESYWNDTAIPYSVNFNCSVVDDSNTTNMSLYLTNSNNQSFGLNETCQINAATGSCEWNIGLERGNYTWSCLAYDNLGFEGWGSNRTVLINATQAISWFSSSLDLGSAKLNTGALSSNLSIKSVGDNNNVTVTCLSGSCGNITDNWVYNTNMTDGDSYDTTFTCNDSIVGVYSAIYGVNSSEVPLSNEVEVTCLINQTYGNLNISLVYPDPTKLNRLFQNETFALQATVTCNGTLGAFCGNISATPRYNLTISVPSYGTGNDGSVNVTSFNTTLNNYTYLTANVVGGSSSLTVDNTSEFNAGDEILIIQVQDGLGGTAGTYEFITIGSVATNTINLDGTLSNSYNTGTYNSPNPTVTQIVRVPNYENVYVGDGATIIPKPWDGYSGGVVAFRASGYVEMNGTGQVNVSGKGFRGGPHTDLNGGCGGNNPAAEHGEGTKTGFDEDDTCGDGVEYPVTGSNGGAGDETDLVGGTSGAGGSYATQGGFGYQATGTNVIVAYPGEIVGSSDLSVMIFGGGGGSGGDNDLTTNLAFGGTGGGIVYIGAYNISEANVYSIGSSGKVGNDGAGGSGAGGTIYLIAENLNVTDVNASGGPAFDAGSEEYRVAAGGDGRIRLDYTNLEGSTNPDFGYNGSPSFNYYEYWTDFNLTSGGKPFYSFTSYPLTCNANQGESCQFTWTINSTGEIGTYRKMQVNFSSNYSVVSYIETNNASVEIALLIEPNVTLNSPEQDTVDETGTILINCSAEDDGDIVNISIFHNASGTFKLNYTETFSGSFDVTANTTKSYLFGSEVNILWNCLTYDDLGYSAWGESNYTFSVDYPVMSYTQEDIGLRDTNSAGGICIDDFDNDGLQDITLLGRNRTGINIYQSLGEFFVNETIIIPDISGVGFSGTFDQAYGNESILGNNDFDYGYIGSNTVPALIRSVMEIRFDGVHIQDETKVNEINVFLNYCHAQNYSGIVACHGENASGTIELHQNVSLYDFANNRWTSLGEMNTNDSAELVNGMWNITGNLDDYINDSNNAILVGAHMRYSNFMVGHSSFLVLDYAKVYVKQPNNEANNYSGDSCSFGDYDNDGYPDLITGADLVLFHNDKGIFNCVDSENDNACSGSALPVSLFDGAGVQFFDYNNDSYLDIWASSSAGARIFQNDGDGTFSIQDIGKGTLYFTAVADYDGDGLVDLFGVNVTTSGNYHVIYRNLGSGSYSLVDAASIGIATKTKATTNTEDFHHGFGDYDNDGDLDLFITYTGIAERNIFENNGDGTFTNQTNIGLPDDDLGTDPVWGDYNNDGYMDLFIGGVGLFSNDGDGTFTDVTSSLGLTNIPDSVEFIDMDNDGDLDIVGQNSSGSSIFYRNYLDDSHYLKIMVHGLGNTTYKNFSNRDAIGTKIDLFDSSGTLVCHREVSGGEAYGQSAKILHCGGVDRAEYYTINVTFPSGYLATEIFRPKDKSQVIGKNILTQTIEINETDVAPITTLNFPYLIDTSVDGNILFNCSATDQVDIVNISFYHNLSGVFKLNQTTTFSGLADINAIANFSVNQLSNRTNFVWNCLSYDVNGLSSFADNNHTMTINNDYIQVGVDTTQTTYQTGTDAVITTNTTNSQGNPLVTNVTLDIIQGVATAHWWNTSWKKRVPLYIDENGGSTRSGERFGVNITGLSGSINNCNVELRVILNESNTLTEVPYEALSGDNSTYCFIRFKGNATANSQGVEQYYVYYNNTNASTPSYEDLTIAPVNLLFEDFESTDWSRRAATCAASDECDANSPWGEFNDCDDQSDDWLLCAEDNQYAGSYAILFQDIDVYDDSSGLIFYFDASPYYDINISGYSHTANLNALEWCSVWITDSDSADDVYRCSDGDACDTGTAAPVPGDYIYFEESINSLSGITTTDGLIALHLGGDSSGGGDYCRYDNINITGFKNYEIEVNVTHGNEEEWVYRDTNVTLVTGLYTYNFNTSGYEVGNYSAVSLGERVNYQSGSSSKVFALVSDLYPVITILAPENGSTLNDVLINLSASTVDSATCEYSDDILFEYGTGTTFTTTGDVYHESLLSLSEGSYTRYVKCIDGLGNKNNITNQESVSFTVDRTAPTVVINSPENNSNETSSSIIFTWTATDAIDSELLCDFTLDGQTIAADVSSPSGSSVNYPVNNLANGNYSWNVTCEDNAPNNGLSDTYVFKLEIIDYLISIQQENISYKQDENVNLYLPEYSFEYNDSLNTFFIPEEYVSYAYVVGGFEDLRSDRISWDYDLGKSFDPSRTFIISRSTAEYDGDITPDTFLITAKLRNETHLGLDRYTNGITGNVSYYIIESTNLNVINGSITSSAGTIDETIPDIGSNYNDKCFVSFSATIDGSTVDDVYESKFLTNLTSSTNLRFTRQASTTEAAIEYYVVCFTDNSTVQTGEVSLSGSSVTDTILNPVNTSNAFIIFNNDADTNGLAQVSVRGQITSSTEVQFDRTNPSGSAIIRWYVIEFENGTGSYVQRGSDAAVTADFIELSTVTNAVNLSRAIPIATYDSSGTGTAFPRPYWTSIFSDSTEILHHRGRQGQPSNIEWEAVEWQTEIQERETQSINYSFVGDNYSKLSYIKIILETSMYNGSGSQFLSNNYPDLEVRMFNGVDFGNTFTCGLFDFYGNGSTTQYNCSTNIKNQTILNLWNNASNRILNIKGVYFDEEDSVNLTNVSVTMYTPSRLEGLGPTNLTRYLLLQVLKNESGSYVNYQTIYNQSTSVGYNEVINLSFIWESVGFSSGNNPLGGYRVYSAFTDSNNNVITNGDGLKVEDYSDFTIDFLRINITSPDNNSIIDAQGEYANITLEYISYSSGGWCGYQIDNQSNVSMLNISDINYLNFTGPVSVGNHNITFFCNDSVGGISHSNTHYFEVQDLVGPNITLLYPLNDSEGITSPIIFVYNVTDFSSGIENCTLIFDLVETDTNYTVTENVNQTFTVGGVGDGVHNWQIRCYDNSTNENVASSQVNTFLVGTDDVPPVVTLTYPDNNTFTQNNDVLFTYTVTDYPQEKVDNCSLIINGVINHTNSTIFTAGAENNFTINDMALGDYNWSVNCTDGSLGHNVGSSLVYNLSIGEDLDAPLISLQFPLNNSKDTDGNIVFVYRVNDTSSGIENCSLLFDGVFNQSSLSISETIDNYFYINGLLDGNYTWQVNCTDDSFQKNWNVSELFNLTVQIVYGVEIEVVSEQSLYEKGTDFNETASINTTTRDEEVGSLVNANISTYLIPNKSWFSPGWKHRKQLNITSIGNRTDAIVNVTIDTEFLISEGKLQGGCEDIRFTLGNKSELEYWIEDETSCNTTNTVVWFRTNLTIGNNVHYFYYDNPFSNNESNPYVLDSIGESGSINISGFQWHLIEFSRTYEHTPVVVAVVSTQNSGLDNHLNPTIGWVNETHMNISICEDIGNAACNAAAVEETVNYFVFDVNKSNNQTWLDVGWKNYQPNGGSNDENWGKTFSNAPHVFATANTYNQSGNVAATIWLDDALITTTQGRFISCTHQGIVNSCDAGSATETFAFVAIDITNENISNFQSGEANIANSVWTNMSFSPNYIDPLVMVTANDDDGGSDPKNPWARDITPAGGQFRYCEQDDYDVCDSHADVWTSWFSMEKGYILLGSGSTVMVNTQFGVEEGPVFQYFGETGLDGVFPKNFSIANITVNTYYVVSRANSTEYNGGYNFTSIEIANDKTAPIVGAVWPDEGYVSATGNETFIYNVTDILSGVASCKLIYDGVDIGISNNTITEGVDQYLTRLNMPNGPHTWQVNCTDDYGNIGSSTPRNFNVSLDLEGPGINLISPINYWTDTNGNVSLIFTVNDVYNGIENCTLYLNGIENETLFSLSEGIENSINYTLDDGAYYWNMTCYDDSDAFNGNNSLTEYFYVYRDTWAPNITLIEPIDGYPSVSDNISFYYNVSDNISNIDYCEITLDGVVNITNTSVVFGDNQSFRILGIPPGDHYWNITCNDTSEYANQAISETWYFKVSPDDVAPVINLAGPPNGTQDPDGNITFIFNVTDSASSIANCTLIINGEANYTEIEPPEDENIPIIRNDFAPGEYNWSVNCTDDAFSPNTNSSETWTVVVGQDTIAPVVTLVNPDSGILDTDGSLYFIYKVVDFGTDISNCSLIINGTINQTNDTVTKDINQNFSVSGFENSTYLWSVNCTDSASTPNIGNSSIRNFSVLLDETAPIVISVLPLNESSDSDGDVDFVYQVTDTLNNISECRLYINSSPEGTPQYDVEQGTNQTINFAGLSDGFYVWNIGCWDNSDNSNFGQTEIREITIQNDIVGPEIHLISPPDGAAESDGNRVFYYNVSDVISGIAYCSILFDGVVQNTSTSIIEDVPLNFSITGIPDGNLYWNVSCVDSSDNSNPGDSETWLLDVRLDNDAPIVTLLNPENYTQHISNNVTFYYNVSDLNNLSNCSIYINGTLNTTLTDLETNSEYNFTINNIPDSSIMWNVSCIDKSESEFEGWSESWELIVGPDLDSPTVTLVSPPPDIQDTDGNVTFVYTVDDFASALSNCSLIINGTINQTNSTITEGINNNFTLNNMGLGDYTWEVNCTDNSTNANTGSSGPRNLTIDLDATAPTINLTSPLDGVTVNSNQVWFEYDVFDYASNIENCSLIIDGVINQTNSTINQSIPQFFYVGGIEDGDYTWGVNCTDTSILINTGESDIFTLTIFKPRQLHLNVTVNDTDFEQGQFALITSNSTNSTLDKIETNLSIDIIQGNATAPWWNTSWKYRVEVLVNSTNSTRINRLVEHDISFTDILSDLGESGLNVDTNSVRVVEYLYNMSNEISSIFIPSNAFDSATNAIGQVVWVLNGTTNQDIVRGYYVYFDVTENGAKSAANYSQPDYAFTGDSNSVDFDGTSIDANAVEISFGDEKFTLRMDEGDYMPNMLSMDYPGAASISNVYIDNERLTNDNSSIVPFGILDEDFYNGTSTTTIYPGAISRVQYEGVVNSITGTMVQVNYTIWFEEDEIFLKAEVHADMGNGETSPSVYFDNLWMAYLFDEGTSSWNSFANRLNSELRNQTHNYNNLAANNAEKNEFYATDWYSEYDDDGSLGSINLFVEDAQINSVDQSTGIVSFNDIYTSRGHGVGFNLNSDVDVASSDIYDMTVWMVFSGNSSSYRARDLKADIENPILVSEQSGQKLVNRTTATTTNAGFSFEFDTNGQTVDWYGAVGSASKLLYIDGIDYYLFQITPDITAPIVNWVSPYGWVSTTNVTFAFNVSDTNPVISSCYIIINDTANESSTSITNYAENTITVNNLPDGYYTWGANCTDEAGNVGQSSTSLLIVDTIVPSINLTYPDDLDTVNETPVDFNFTVTDNLAENFTCTLTANDIVEGQTDTTYGVLTNITPNLLQDVYIWNITCIDQAGNENSSLTRTVTIDTGPPGITLVYPVPPSNWESDGNVTFYYLPQDTSDISNCSLFIDDSLITTNFSITKNINNNFTENDISEGRHNWTVQCVDLIGQTGITSTELFYIDLTEPSIDLVFPQDSESYIANTLDFNFTVTDNLADNLLCNITLDDVVTESNLVVLNGTNHSETISSLSEGQHYWNVSCWDNASNINTSLTFNFFSGEAPVVNLTSPVDGYWHNYQNITFYYNATDNVNVSNCSIVLDGNLNYTNYTIINGSNNFTINDIPDGYHNWSVNCTDTSNLISSSNILDFYIDVTPPNPIIKLPQGQNFTDNTPEIPFNITDDLADVINFTFIIDHTTYDISGQINNSNNSQVNLSALAQGYHNVTLLAIDRAGNRKNSTNVTIFIDSVAPIITIENPSDSEVLGFVIQLLSTITDSGIGIDTVWYTIVNDTDDLMQSGNLNLTDSWDAIWNSSEDVNNVSHTNNMHFNVSANDSLGNIASLLVSFVVDNKNPVIDIIVPNGDYFNLNFNLSISVQNHHLQSSWWNITDALGVVKDNNSNQSILQPSFDWGDLINISDTGKYPDGIYNITVYANDTVGNNRTVKSYFTIDRTNPGIVLDVPIHGFNTSLTTIDFNFTATDNLDNNLTCNLTIDDVVVVENHPALNGSLTNISQTGLTEGSSLWNVTCWDDTNNVNVSETRKYTVDNSNPSIQLIAPEMNHWNNTGSIIFEYIPIDTFSQISSCSLIIRDKVNQTNLSISNATLNTFNLFGLEEQIFNWTVNCTDAVGNVGMNDTPRWIYVDLFEPNVTILTANKTWFNDSTPEILFNITDSGDSVLNYTFFVNYTFQAANGTVNSGELGRDNLSWLADGLYNLTLEGWDDINLRVNSTTILFYVDTEAPNVTLHSPLNGSNETQDVMFNYSVTDNMDNNLTCNLTIGGQVNESNMFVENGTSYNLTINEFPIGQYYWNVYCLDNAGNIGTSETWLMNITPPDLYVNGSEILFNNTTPLEGENVTINVTVRNIGTALIEDALVEVFEGDPDDNGIFIGNATVTIDYDSFVNVYVNWTAKIGTTEIFVVLDRQNVIPEIREDNNKANTSIFVSSWSIIYGESLGELYIKDLENITLFDWYVNNATSGNIYATDLESNINWINVSAIGRDVLGGIAFDDYAEIDSILNSSLFEDSVNITYTENGVARNLTTFYVFKNTIANVSFVNSTNTTNFISGILWDVGDDIDGEYDGNEDIIFATKINPNSVGMYGIYDFEIRVPSLLKKYYTTDVNSIVFYAELK